MVTNFLGWLQEKIAKEADLSRTRLSKIVGNTNFGKIDTFFSQSHHDMEYTIRDFIQSKKYW